MKRINNIGLINKEDVYLKYLLSKTTNSNIIDYYKNSNKLEDLVIKNSPKNICINEKKRFERIINLLDMNVDTLIHSNECLYSKFYDVYEEILKDLGFKFRIISISKLEVNNIYKVYKELKVLNSKLSFIKYIVVFINTKYIISILHKIKKEIKENIGFELNKGEYISIYKFFVQEIINSKGIISIRNIYEEN